ncbi:MAG: hypothetical protein HY832_03910, partial [Candidatus Aenigmarchaeota archaeon]|nr:hypothetical protein [Candidatus Aenigmarchaeota archaeon]
FEGAVSQQKPRGKKEVKQIDDLGIDSFISPATVVSKDVDLQDVAKLLKTNEEVFIADAGQFYVVTPKDVLEAEFLQPQPPVHVQFSNLGNEDPYIAYQIEQSVAGFGDKMKVMLPGLQSCAFHLERHYHGGKVKYSLRARMYSSLGMTVARAWGWDPFTATQEVLKKLEREAVGRKGKVHDRNERRRYDTKRR